MLFNSIEFIIFLPAVFILYWFVFNKNLQLQNFLIVLASYIFYGWWDWRFLFLIIFSSILDYSIGIGLHKTKSPLKRKFLLFLSVLFNIGFLVFFKYFNFFVANFVTAFTLLGKPIMNTFTLNIILPVGISFYTFQTLSYSIDIYKRKLEPTNNIISFFAFVTFFPQLVAGPIERATNLLPQFYKKRNFNYNKAVDGMRQILWGMFKKIVIADNCAPFVNVIFKNYSNYSGSTLLIGAFLFAFQIYGDFSGYSDIAIGTSRLFGFSLMKNFAFPYFSRDIAEFWRRWHISLSTWFRDYIYIPLGGSKGSNLRKIINTFIIFIISGFWHGANWTYILWGALNAIYFIPLMLTQKNRRHIEAISSDRIFPTATEVFKISLTFVLTLFAWIFFRAKSVNHALEYISRLISPSLISVPEIFPRNTLIFISFLIIIEWLQRTKSHGLELTNKRFPKYLRWIFYYGILLIIGLYAGKQEQFIYFQF